MNAGEENLYRHRQCDVLIAGAGPAGMAAALAAAESGSDIIVIDDNPQPGGQIWRNGPAAKVPGRAMAYRQKLGELKHVTFLSKAKVFAAPESNRILYEDDDECGDVVCQTMILCSGARELLLPFPGWTLPGVTGVGALQALIKGGVSLAGQRVVIAGSGPLLLSTAHSVRQAKGHVLCIAEQAPLRQLIPFAMGFWRWPSKAVQAVTLMDRHFRSNCHVLDALGKDRLEGVRLQNGRQEMTIPCDRLACGFGLVGNTELAQLLGCVVRDQAIVVDQWQSTDVKGVFAAGECAGIGGSELAMAEGAIAGFAAVDRKQRAVELFGQRARWRRFASALSRTFRLPETITGLSKPDTMFCRCEDVPFSELAEETDWTSAKLHSRCGMGACQGKICGTAAHRIFGWTPPQPKVPLVPVRIGTLERALKAVTANGRR